MKQKHLFLLLLLFLFSVSVQSQRFIDDILRFQAIDAEQPPPENVILFIGSSSFTMWYDVADYFPEHKIINRAFGGSTLEDLIRYHKELILPYNPIQIVIYCGENDFGEVDTLSVQTVANRFTRLFELIRTELPQVPIAYVSMKPSPFRWHLSRQFEGANGTIEEFLMHQEKAAFIDVWSAMLNTNCIPDSTIFLEDMLHMNAEGYKIWERLIAPHLLN